MVERDCIEVVASDDTCRLRKLSILPIVLCNEDFTIVWSSAL